MLAWAPYEIVGLVGAGGMGEVYRARDGTLGREVALKVLSTTAALDVDRVSRFRHEAEVLAAVNHPHIGAIFGIELPMCVEVLKDLRSGSN